MLHSEKLTLSSGLLILLFLTMINMAWALMEFHSPFDGDPALSAAIISLGGLAWLAGLALVGLAVFRRLRRLEAPAVPGSVLLVSGGAVYLCVVLLPASALVPEDASLARELAVGLTVPAVRGPCAAVAVAGLAAAVSGGTTAN